MKVNNLMTLSQFVELMKLRVYDGMEDYGDFVAKSLGLIYRYAEFLKQPLKKEMVVNELPMPTEQYNSPQYYEGEMAEWSETEKKVIFKNVSILEGNILELPIGEFNPYLEMKGVSLHDLAEATNGELKLKNIEL